MTTMPTDYEPLVKLERHNGAWLIVMNRNDITEDWGYIEMVNCASGLDKAKRVARSMASEIAADGSGFRWEHGIGGYVLHGRLDQPDEY